MADEEVKEEQPVADEAPEKGAFDGADEDQSGSEQADAPDKEASDSQSEAFDDPTAGEETSDDDADTSEQEKQSAPETYEDFKLPEGVELDDDRKNSFVEWSKKSNLSQEQAQSAIDLYIKMVDQDTGARVDAWKQQAQMWTQASKAAGLMSPDNLAMAKVGLKAVDADGSLGAIISDLAIDRHPALLSVFRSYGEQISPPQEVTSASAIQAQKQQSRREILYPTLANKE